MKTKTLILASLLLSGCATCREHPTACKAVAAAVVMGTVIALDHRGAAQAAPAVTTQPVNCVPPVKCQ